VAPPAEGWREDQENRKTCDGGQIPASSGDDLLRLIIDRTMISTSHSPTAGNAMSKLKSKYFSLLNYAYSKRVKAGDFIEFVDQVGGVNYSARRASKRKAYAKV
jgi:hypothetical protein